MRRQILVFPKSSLSPVLSDCRDESVVGALDGLSHFFRFRIKLSDKAVTSRLILNRKG